MLRIRLQRMGKAKQPTYRFIVSERTRDTQAGSLEILGLYNPVVKEKVIDLKIDRIKHWLSVGAQPSPTVFNLLVSAGVIEGKKQSVVSLTNKRRKKLGDKLIEQEQKKREAEEKAAQEVQAKKDAEAAAAAAKEVTEVTPEETSEEPAA